MERVAERIEHLETVRDEMEENTARLPDGTAVFQNNQIQSESARRASDRRLQRERISSAPDGPKSVEFAKWRANQEYIDAPYHGATSTQRKNARPKNPRNALDNSYIFNSNNKNRRIGVDNLSNEFVVFGRTRENIWHGHTRSWDELTNPMQAKLRSEKIVTKNGKIK